ncbi:cyclic nucleotide-binding domain-containing protein [Candidatus Poribacteria bacterium]|jgi:CRP/FNR family transcriptional regulator, cyclic AMP receptor protein|nr:cyclic nucleotide-binding domain-containing protein [Candidatus Poribacteria bacterium]MBT5535889.1 cyclic nucleotide-binding domain-containing protein [Candidatus Poribacteria bacterium]MBT5710123.1 cyclic nucleotide-binding domain-containing protein [Candidatus Poribacteria bacterium]MBT7099654.1 cyclic nucleotide-binding domain-containing protein [Candidatus Poribacteria bacterium]MBT7805222.1 cyclic nucleotide-binding domain-containing protein [Candidatus Poribacteria bacterium]
MADVTREDLRRFCQGMPVGIFDGLEDDQLDAIAAITERAAFEDQQVIIEDGSDGDTMYLLLSGKVRVTKKLFFRSGRTIAQGEREIIELPAEWNPYFGELALFDAASSRTATVAGSEAGEYGVINNADFYALAEGDHDIGYVVLKNVLMKAVGTIRSGNQNVINLTTALSFSLTSR